MDNIIIASEHRVGSRWLHYLLADILDKKVSPEMDVTRLTKDNSKINERFRNNKIVKFHRARPITIFEKLPGDYSVIGVVRNPRDRGVSLCFHNRYHETNPDNYKESKFDTDKEAMEYTILKSHGYKEANKRQRDYMINGYSTRGHFGNSINYIWTSYEWMKEDIFREIKTILDFLKIDISPQVIAVNIHRHSFSKKAGRQAGTENREDTWRRKGVNNDWVNWFTPEMERRTQVEQELYCEILNKNEVK